jgi:cell division septation protein DedD
VSREAYEAYEVTLSNTQIAAFVALLVLAVVGAFAAGVWWGQSKATDLAGVQEEEAPASEPVLSAVEPPAAATEPEPAEVVRFFGVAGDEDAGAGGAPAAAAADPPSQAVGAALVVQVFSSADAQQAASVEQKLRADGHRAFLSPQTLDGQVMQRVRVGPFEDQAAAGAAAELLAKQYGLETWITPNN